MFADGQLMGLRLFPYVPVFAIRVGMTHNKFKRGFATGCFGHRVFLVTHDAVKYSNGH